MASMLVPSKPLRRNSSWAACRMAARLAGSFGRPGPGLVVVFSVIAFNTGLASSLFILYSPVHLFHPLMGPIMFRTILLPGLALLTLPLLTASSDPPPAEPPPRPALVAQPQPATEPVQSYPRQARPQIEPELDRKSTRL